MSYLVEIPNRSIVHAASQLVFQRSFRKGLRLVRIILRDNPPSLEYENPFQLAKKVKLFVFLLMGSIIPFEIKIKHSSFV